jgi:hypothetical protein
MGLVEIPLSGCKTAPLNDVWKLEQVQRGRIHLEVRMD